MITEGRPIIAAAGILAPSILAALRPAGPAWTELPLPFAMPPSMIDGRKFYHTRGYNVLSCIELIDGEGRAPAPEYHISISKVDWRKRRANRCPNDEALWILKCFDLDGWEEDNHVPGGVVRNYWRPVAENNVGKECPCKETETPVIEGDFTWRHAP